ncbi:DUF1772 domain-containing protein [bacterium]|nr:DUF1772 domain-containing protein [bacterium]
MDILHIAIILSALLCSLAAGLSLAFAIIVMPGIRTLDDHDYLRAFAAVDRVIQNHSLLFILVWGGSIVAVLMMLVLGSLHAEGAYRMLIWIATAAYFLGVQLPTVVVNVPLNNALQRHDLAAMSTEQLRIARENFEPPWVRWNAIRTLFAVLTSAVLIILVFGL